MSSRILAPVAASLFFVTQCYAEPVKGQKQTPQQIIDVGLSPTEKANKSNPSDRMGGGGGGKGAAGVTTVKGAKSNSSDRMGGGGGGKGAVQLNPQPEPPGRR